MTTDDRAALEATLIIAAALGRPDATLRFLRDDFVTLRLELQEALARELWVTSAALPLRWLADLEERGRALALRTWELLEDLAGRRFDLLEAYLPLDERLEPRRPPVPDPLARA